jgi:hypothetical protein
MLMHFLLSAGGSGPLSEVGAAARVGRLDIDDLVAPPTGGRNPSNTLIIGRERRHHHSNMFVQNHAHPYRRGVFGQVRRHGLVLEPGVRRNRLGVSVNTSG